MPDWTKAREEMLLDPTVINLNTGSFGPLPRCVFDKATELRRRLAEEPMAFFVREAGPLLWQARECLGSFIGAEAKRLLFTANVSAGINMVAASLRLAAPGEILLSDHEYGTMHWCWERAAQRQGLSIRTFPLPAHAEHPNEIVDIVNASMSERTRLLFFSHVYSPTGLVMPAAALCRLAKERGILSVIDGAHAAAMIPLQLDRLGCDFYGGNCHKWLLAPSGSGFLYIGAGNESSLRPLHVSWGWHYDHLQADELNPFGATHRLYQLEFEGTRDPCAWLAVPTAISFQETLGWEKIRQRNADLIRHMRGRLAEELGLRTWTPLHPKLHGYLTAFLLPKKIAAEPFRERMWRERIEVNVFELPYGVLLRVSTHFFNTNEEIDRLGRVVADVIV